MVVKLDSLPDVSLEAEKSIAKKLCVLKLNGGLGKLKIEIKRKIWK